METRFGRVYEFEGFALDASRRNLSEGASKVTLRPKSFDVLCILAERAGSLVTKADLANAVWPGMTVSDESLARCVSDIRLALRDREQHMVKTVPGRGYTFAVRVSLTPATAMSEPASGMAVPSSPDRPSIAVLPFANVSMAADQAVFSDGLTEDITSALSRFKSFLVIGRNTTSVYNGQLVDPRRLGRELGVRYVLEGSVRSAGDDIRVTAQLLETEAGSHLWAGRYDRKLEHIFAIQDEITTSIVGRLGPELLVAEYARASRKPAHSLDAWACVIRALHHSAQQSESESRKALEFLDRALHHDADYAQALGMKAWLLVFRAFQGWEDMGEALQHAASLIAHALAVDNEELWPYLAQGMVGYATRDNELSMAALTRAVELSPNSVNAHGLLGNAHAFGGRSVEALACIQQAMRLSPRDTYLSDFDLYRAFAYFQGAQYEVGLKFAQQAHRLRPGHAYPIVVGASCAGHLGEIAIGSNLLLELKAIMPMVSAGWIEATTPFVRADDRARLVEGLLVVGLQ